MPTGNERIEAPKRERSLPKIGLASACGRGVSRRNRAQTLPAQAIVEAGRAWHAGLRQRQPHGFLAAPARPADIAGEFRATARATHLPRAAAALRWCSFHQAFRPIVNPVRSLI